MVGARPLFRALGRLAGWGVGAGLRRAGVALVRFSARWPAQSALPPVTHPAPPPPVRLQAVRLKAKAKQKAEAKHSKARHMMGFSPVGDHRYGSVLSI